MRLPLAVNLRSRDGTLARDARLQNALIEKVGVGDNGPIFDILGRPGMSDGGLVGRVGVTPQLLYSWNGSLYMIHGDALSIGAVSQLVANFSTLNSSDKSANVTLSSGNLTATGTAGSFPSVRGNYGKSSGKWYFEVSGTGSDYLVGVALATAGLASFVGADANGWGVESAGGSKWTAGASAAYTSAFSANETVGIAYDGTAGTITVYRSGVSAGVMFSGLAGTVYPMASPNTGNGAVTVNFGQSTFAFGPPSGYTPWNNVAALTPTNASQPFDAQETNPNAGTPRLMIKNRSQAWHISNAGTVTPISLPGTMGAFTSGIVGLTRSSTTATATYYTATRPVQVGDSVTVAGANDANYNGTFTVTAVNTSSYPYSFSYTVGGSPVTPDTSTSIRYTLNGGMVRGIPYINGYFCVMDVNGVIWHSNADDPSTWSAAAFLTSRNENGAGVALGKSLNYLIAFKEWSTEFYYDAKNTTGSAFSAVENGFVRIGCASGDSLALAAAQLVWIGQTKSQGFGIYAMQGLNARKISTEDVDRVLASANFGSGVYAAGMNCRGHELYVVTITSANVTLIYDFSSDTWTTWTSLTRGVAVTVSSITRSGTTATVTTSGAHGFSDGDPVIIAGANQGDYNGNFQIQYVSATVFTIEVANSPVTPATGTLSATPYTETYFKMIRAAVYQGAIVLLHASDGHLYQMSTSLYRDTGIPINIFGLTDRIDGGSDDVKKMGRVRVICDSASSGTAMVSWSDDDAQTFQAYRLMNLASDPCETNKCGSFRRRTLAFRHVANASLRARALEIG